MSNFSSESGEISCERKGVPSLMRNNRDSFTEYENSTEDVWQIDDADVDSKQPIISKERANELAKKIIDEHRENVIKERYEDVSPKERRSGGPGVCVRVNEESIVRRSSLTNVDQKVSSKEIFMIGKFKSVLYSSNVDLDLLRHLSWIGIPKNYRSLSWKILSVGIPSLFLRLLYELDDLCSQSVFLCSTAIFIKGYVSCNAERRELVLKRKREEYWSFVKQYYDASNESTHKETFRQINIDIPRMNNVFPIFKHDAVREAFKRILFIYAFRHPASGYVQGMNDLITPFFVVFLSDFFEDGEFENIDVSALSPEILDAVEADSFWCASFFLDSIQDNYTFAQPGIQNNVKSLEELIHRIDGKLFLHLKKHNVEFLQFAFRWMNNLLMRELPLSCAVRLWDTYHAEGKNFSTLHLYVCVSFLVRFSEELRSKTDFQSLMLTLQNLPTHSWQAEDISLLTADAYRLMVLFADSPRHVKSLN